MLGDELRGHFKQEELIRWATADVEGHYEIRLGPGRYELRGPYPAATQDLTLGEEEEEVVRDFTLPWSGRGPLRGVVRRVNGDVVCHAIVCGEGVVQGHAGFETTSDGEGRFSSERWRERMIVYARTPTGEAAGCAEINEQTEEVEVVVSPATIAGGRVVDAAGMLMSNETVFCRMKVALRDETTVTFQIESRTDAAGAFSIVGLLICSICDVTVLRAHTPVVLFQPFTTAEAGRVPLSDLVLA